MAGLYVAVQGAPESTVTAESFHTKTLNLGIGMLGTVNGAAKFASSASVGLLWTSLSPIAAFGVAAVLMGAGTVLLAGAETLASES